MFVGEPRSAAVQIDAGVDVYEVHVEFLARLGGVRWMMYRWRIVSFLVFTGLFWGTEMVWALGMWWWVSAWLGSGGKEEKLVEEEEEEEEEGEGDGEDRGEGRREEEGEVLHFDDVQRTFPTPLGRPPLRPSYLTPETTPAPEGEGDWTPDSGESRVGDDEEEDYNEEYERLVEAGTSRITDSGLGTTMSESAGRGTGRERSQSGSHRRRR